MLITQRHEHFTSKKFLTERSIKRSLCDGGDFCKELELSSLIRITSYPTIVVQHPVTLSLLAENPLFYKSFPSSFHQDCLHSDCIFWVEQFLILVLFRYILPHDEH